MLTLVRPTHLMLRSMLRCFKILNQYVAVTSFNSICWLTIRKHDQMKSDFDSKMVWGESQMRRGSSDKAEPCAKPGCTPFPTCCSTQKI